MASAFLDLYDPLDIIGNGSFGIIRKVRRKSDGLVGFYVPLRSLLIYNCTSGQIFARKELNFERMSERDRKQIVAEVYVVTCSHLSSSG
jgi:NIMA (never in mitosis gene a)-related kinase